MGRRHLPTRYREASNQFIQCGKLTSSPPFGPVPSEVLFDVFESRRNKRRPSLVYYGDHRGAKLVAARLIRDVGFF